MSDFLDSIGVNHLWNKIKAKVDFVITDYIAMRDKFLVADVIQNEQNVRIGSTVDGSGDDTSYTPVVIDGATKTTAGVMSSNDKAKVDRITFGPDIMIGVPSMDAFALSNVNLATFIKQIRTNNVFPCVIYGRGSDDTNVSYTCVVTNANSTTLTLSGGGIGGYANDTWNAGNTEETSVTLNSYDKGNSILWEVLIY